MYQDKHSVSLRSLIPCIKKAIFHPQSWARAQVCEKMLEILLSCPFSFLPYFVSQSIWSSSATISNPEIHPLPAGVIDNSEPPKNLSCSLTSSDAGSANEQTDFCDALLCIVFHSVQTQVVELPAVSATTPTPHLRLCNNYLLTKASQSPDLVEGLQSACHLEKSALQ